MGGLADMLAQTRASMGVGGDDDQGGGTLAGLLADTRSGMRSPPRSASEQEANGPDMPSGGRQIEMPTQQIEGDPHEGVLDAILRQVSQQGDRADQASSLRAQAAPGQVGSMIYGGSYHLADPLRDARRADPPDVQRVNEGFGAAINPVNYLAVPAAGEGLIAAGARNAAVQGFGGGAQRYADDPNASAGQVLGSAARAAAPAFLAGAGTQSIARGLGGAAQSAGAAADDARLAQANIPDQLTPAARAALAQRIEQAGLTDGIAASRSTVADRATSYAGAAGNRMRGAEEQIAQLPNQPTVNVGNTIDAQRAAASRELDSIEPAAAGVAGYRNQVANNLERVAGETGPNGELPWQRALEERRMVDQYTKFGAQPGADAAVNQARMGIGGDLRRGTQEALNSPSVPPELAQRWQGANDDFSLGAKVAENASGRPGIGVPNSLPTSPLGAARAVAQVAGTGRMPGLVADAARGTQNVLGTGADMTQASPAAAAALQQWLAGKGSGSQMPQQQPSGSASSTQGSTGGVSGQRAVQALQVNPQLLGKWAPQFDEAQRTGGVEAVNALITKLVLSNDPEFRNGPYRQLQQGQPNAQ